MEKSGVFDFQLDLLKAEMDSIRQSITAYDNLSFQIKGWAITLWSAVIALALKDLAKGLVVVSIGMAAVAVVVFWVLDATFKHYQRRATIRMAYIEDFLHGRGPFEGRGVDEAFQTRRFDGLYVPDPIGRTTVQNVPYYRDQTGKHAGILRSMWADNVALIYITLLVVSVVLAAVLRA